MECTLEVQPRFCLARVVDRASDECCLDGVIYLSQSHVRLQVGFWHPIGFAQMTLSLIPEILDPVDVVLAQRKVLRVVNPVIPKGGNVQHIIRAVAVGVHDAVGDDLLLHDAHQRLPVRVGDGSRVDLSAPL